MPWSTVVLAVDEDLTNLEPDMPALAQRNPGDSGITAYDGKRAVTKRRIEEWIRGRGLDPDGLTRTAQLNDAAVALELSLIYQAMASRNESVYLEKSEIYRQQYVGFMRDMALEYVNTRTASAPAERAPIRMIRS